MAGAGTAGKRKSLEIVRDPQRLAPHQVGAGKAAAWEIIQGGDLHMGVEGSRSIFIDQKKEVISHTQPPTNKGAILKKHFSSHYSNPESPSSLTPSHAAPVTYPAAGLLGGIPPHIAPCLHGLGAGKAFGAVLPTPHPPFQSLQLRF